MCVCVSVCERESVCVLSVFHIHTKQSLRLNRQVSYISVKRSLAEVDTINHSTNESVVYAGLSY